MALRLRAWQSSKSRPPEELSREDGGGVVLDLAGALGVRRGDCSVDARTNVEMMPEL